MADKEFKATIVLLKGNHSTYVRGRKPGEIEQWLVEARQHEKPFAYLHDAEPEETDGCINKVAVDPRAVVGLMAHFS